MENQRIRLSKTMLKDALMALLLQKPIEKITIYELCSRAQINRTTFYKYYGSQYDLLNEIENDFFGQLEELLSAEDVEDPQGICRLLERLEENVAQCRLLINALPDQDFSEKLFHLPVVRALLDSHTPRMTDPWQAEYIRLFFYQGGYAVIRRWINSDNREPPAEIAKLLIGLDRKLLTEA